MDPELARQHTGTQVIYTGGHGKQEHGVITGVNAMNFVMVRYDGETVSKATLPEQLEFAHWLEPSVRVHRDRQASLCQAEGRCSRRHAFIIACRCGARFHTGRLKFTRRHAVAHLAEADQT